MNGCEMYEEAASAERLDLSCTDFAALAMHYLALSDARKGEFIEWLDRLSEKDRDAFLCRPVDGGLYARSYFHDPREL